MSRLEEVVKEFWRLIDIVEESDGGRLFHPTRLEINSCRALDSQKIGKLIEEMKHIVGAEPRVSEAELARRMNPNVCPNCLGTGDSQNHERETNICRTCGGHGEIAMADYHRK